MERLTKRDEYGNADIIGVDSNELQLNLEFEELNKVTDALNRLATYEDTGLSPEQVLELKEKQIPKKAKKTGMKFKALDVETKEVVMYECSPCPSCEKWISKIYKYCQHCGQRIEEN